MRLMAFAAAAFIAACLGCGGGGGSAPALVAPTIKTQPASLSAYAGASVTFTVAANGNPSPSYTWERSNDGGATWTTIAAAESPTYSFSAQSSDNLAQFKAVATNSQGNDTSQAAILTYLPSTYVWTTGGHIGFWKNGIAIDWPTTSNMANVAVTSNVAILGGNFYIGGTYVDMTTNKNVGGYWVNGTWNTLPLEPSGIVRGPSNTLVSGNNVYMSDSNNFNGGYWLNGVWTTTSTSCQITDMESFDNAIYMVANMYGASGAYSGLGTGYWKDGAWVQILADNSGFGTSITVSGSDVYVGGWYSYLVGSVFTKHFGYWKNGSWIGLTSPPSNAGNDIEVASIASLNGNVYATARTSSSMVTSLNNLLFQGYWVNGTYVPLVTQSVTGVSATCVNIVGSDVYVGSNGAGYWKNEAWVALPQSFGEITAFVVQ